MSPSSKKCIRTHIIIATKRSGGRGRSLYYSNDLHAQMVYPLLDHLAQKYEAIDKELGQLMDMAEKYCRM